MSMTFATNVQVDGTDGNGSMISAGPIGIGNHKIFYGTCSSEAEDPKIVDCPSFTSADLVAGAMIYVFFTTTNSRSASTTTMNVNGTGAKNVKKIYNAGVANLNAVGEIQANMTYLFTYNGTYWVMSTMDYNSTYTVSNNTPGNGSYIASNAVARYNLLFQVDEDHLTPLCSGNSTATTKSILTTVSFDPFGYIFYYTTNAAVAANGTIGIGGSYYSHIGVDLSRSFNVDESTNSLTAHKNVYLKVTAPSSSYLTQPKVKLASATPLVQTLPTTNDGCWYILLGRAYSTHQMALYPQHPVYAYVFGNPSGGSRLFEVTKYNWSAFLKYSNLEESTTVTYNEVPVTFRNDAYGKPLIVQKAMMSCKRELVLLASDWSNDDPPTLTITATGGSDLYDIYSIPNNKEMTIGPDVSGLTRELYDDICAAEIVCTDFQYSDWEHNGGNSSASITFTAFGEKPTMDIPVLIHYTGGSIQDVNKS